MRSDSADIAYVIDRSPHKQGKFLPGSRLRILSPDEVFSTNPDDLLILPWNLRDEITEHMSAIRFGLGEGGSWSRARNRRPVRAAVTVSISTRKRFLGHAKWPGKIESGRVPGSVRSLSIARG